MKLLLPVIGLAVALAGCATSTTLVGEVEGCKIYQWDTDETQRAYSIRCKQSALGPDPIKIYNPGGNCKAQRVRHRGISDAPNHEYKVRCTGDFKGAETAGALGDALKINPDPRTNLWVKDPSGRFARR